MVVLGKESMMLGFCSAGFQDLAGDIPPFLAFDQSLEWQVKDKSQSYVQGKFFFLKTLTGMICEVSDWFVIGSFLQQHATLHVYYICTYIV